MALPRTAEAALRPPAPAESTTVPDAVAPPPRHPRFPLFDGLRAIAVLCGLAIVSLLQHFVLFDAPSLWIGSTVVGAWLLFAFGTGLAVASVALQDERRRPALV
jgi:hypothetical protein